jgi:hypothetical protein
MQGCVKVNATCNMQGYGVRQSEAEPKKTPQCNSNPNCNSANREINPPIGAATAAQVCEREHNHAL